MERTLSSAWTFHNKFFVPGILIIFGLLALISFWNDNHLKWLFLLALFFGSVACYFFNIRLKRVRLDEHRLYISNYLTEIEVPLQNVAEVSDIRWLDHGPVTIAFHNEIEFGKSILFLPKIRLFGFKRPHPVIAEIREAVERALRVGIN